MEPLRRKLAERLTLDMIEDERMQSIAHEIGIVNLIKLLDIISGDTVYLPKADNVLVPARDQLILEEFNGHNHRELAEKYGLTVRHMRNICGDGILEGQLELTLSD